MTASFGDLLEQERIKRGWTIKQLATFLGHNRDYIDGIRGGKLAPARDTAERIAEILGITGEWVTKPSVIGCEIVIEGLGTVAAPGTRFCASGECPDYDSIPTCGMECGWPWTNGKCELNCPCMQPADDRRWAAYHKWIAESETKEERILAEAERIRLASTLPWR
jgi:transcriptional regulator with XRE-family HTH domain